MLHAVCHRQTNSNVVIMESTKLSVLIWAVAGTRESSMELHIASVWRLKTISIKIIQCSNSTDYVN